MLPASEGARGRLRNSDRDVICSLSRSISSWAALYLAYSCSLTGFSLVIMTGAGVGSGGEVMGTDMMEGAVTAAGVTDRGAGTGRGAGSGVKSSSEGSGMGSVVVSTYIGWEVAVWGNGVGDGGR